MTNRTDPPGEPGKHRDKRENSEKTPPPRPASRGKVRRHPTAGGTVVRRSKQSGAGPGAEPPPPPIPPPVPVNEGPVGRETAAIVPSEPNAAVPPKPTVATIPPGPAVAAVPSKPVAASSTPERPLADSAPSAVERPEPVRQPVFVPAPGNPLPVVDAEPDRPPTPVPESRPDAPARAVVRCPSCGNRTTVGVLECPRCGIVFGKSRLAASRPAAGIAPPDDVPAVKAPAVARREPALAGKPLRDEADSAKTWMLRPAVVAMGAVLLVLLGWVLARILSPSPAGPAPSTVVTTGGTSGGVIPVSPAREAAVPAGSLTGGAGQAAPAGQPGQSAFDLKRQLRSADPAERVRAKAGLRQLGIPPDYDRLDDPAAVSPRPDEAVVPFMAMELYNGRLLGSWRILCGEDLAGRRDQLPGGKGSVPVFARIIFTIGGGTLAAPVEKVFDAVPGENRRDETVLADGLGPGSYRVELRVQAQFVDRSGTPRLVERSGLALEVGR